MITKTDALTDHFLNYAVAKALGFSPEFQNDSVVSPDPDDSIAFDVHDHVGNHAQSGPLIDHFGISTNKVGVTGCLKGWQASIDKGSRMLARYQLPCNRGKELPSTAFGRTRVEAALRCLVASILGASVEIPDGVVEAVNEFIGHEAASS